MAQSLPRRRPSHSITTYNFQVSIEGVIMRFVKVSGLAREHHTVPYRNGLSVFEGERLNTFGIDAFVPITLENGTASGDEFLYAWLERLRPSAMEITFCDGIGIPMIAWSIAKAMPVKLSASTFDTSANQLSIDTLEIRAAGISMTTINEIGTMRR